MVADDVLLQFGFLHDVLSKNIIVTYMVFQLQNTYILMSFSENIAFYKQYLFDHVYQH